MNDKPAGRPRAFDSEAALRRAVDLFWVRGYAATSLEELLAAMGVARSSFYAVYGSKHRVMLAALDLYTGELLARMQAAAVAAADPAQAVAAILEIVACSRRPAAGCLFVNMASELAPADAEVLKRCRSYLGQVDRLVASLLRRHGVPAAAAKQRSGALLALATGAVTLRKAGEPMRRVRELLSAARVLIG